MGGLGTLLYSRQRPSGEVYGVLRWRHLGEQEVVDAVRSAGGLQTRQAPLPIATMNASTTRGAVALAAGSERDASVARRCIWDTDCKIACQVDVLLGDDLPTGMCSRTATIGTWQVLFARFLSSDALAGCK
jgi:hypothetical protein